jgi:uncharacterized protein (DUF362 family)
MDDITRREFIRRLLAYGVGIAGAGTLLSNVSCSRGPVPQPTAIPTDTVEARAAKPTVASTPTPQPTGPTATRPAAATATVAAEPTATPLPARTPTPPPAAGEAYLAVARGDSPAAMVMAALGALGGIERFVKSGDDVIVKPNICVAYHTYEFAATTNPEVVATLVSLCLGAGARRVRVMDMPFGGTPEQAYARSGIADAVKAAGGEMELMAGLKYQDMDIPDGRDITRWPVYQDALKADVLIDVPIAKNHGLALLTLGMKNLMGLIQNRNGLHINLGQRIADITSLLQPTLTVVDAVRILLANGPTGGNLDDVQLTNTIIASHDIVAADAYAAMLFGRRGADIPATVAGAQMGLGTMDLDSIKIEEIAV